MKLFALIPAITAEWGVWEDFTYCDFDQQQVDEEFSLNELYDQSACTIFCARAAEKKKEQFGFLPGDVLCCDFEKWSNGDKNCHLYEGQETKE